MQELITVKTEDFSGISTLPDNSLTPQISIRINANQVSKQKLPKLKPGICTKCHKGFPTTDLYEQHIKTAHKDDLPHPCSVCGKRFALAEQMRKHKTIHNPKRYSGPPQFSCSLCNKRYHLKVSLESHHRKQHLGYQPPKRPSTTAVKQHHSTKGAKNSNRPKRPPQTFQCPDCDLKFGMKCLLTRHMACHTTVKPFSCPICQQPFATKQRMNAHIKAVHETALKRRSRRRNYKSCVCLMCEKVFKYYSQLEDHMTLHTGEKPYECSKCGKWFRFKHFYSSHVIRHEPADPTGMRTFKCRLCGKESFKNINGLINHRLNIHKSVPRQGELEKPFACGICGKPFYRRIDAIICALLGHDPNSLLKKMFKHKCPKCGPEVFGFPNMAVLRRHWEHEHPDEFLPMDLRRGMYTEKGSCADALPKVKICRTKEKEILNNGPPPVKFEFPLFVELEQLEVSKEGPKKQGRKGSTNLRSHMKAKQNPGRKTKNLSKGKTKISVETDVPVSSTILEIGELVIKEEPAEFEECPNSTGFKCTYCEKTFEKIRALRTHQVRTHKKQKFDG